MNTCDECGIGFATYYQYRDHMDEEHGGVNRPDDATTYDCPRCDETFMVPFEMIQHIAREHPEVESMHFDMG